MRSPRRAMPVASTLVDHFGDEGVDRPAAATRSPWETRWWPLCMKYSPLDAEDVDRWQALAFAAAPG